MDEYLDEQFDSNEEQHWICSNQDKKLKIYIIICTFPLDKYLLFRFIVFKNINLNKRNNAKLKSNIKLITENSCNLK